MTKRELALLTADAQRMLAKNERMGYSIFLKALIASTDKITADLEPLAVLIKLNDLFDDSKILEAYKLFIISSSKTLIPSNLKLMIRELGGKYQKNDTIDSINAGFRNEEIIKRVFAVSNSVEVADKVTSVNQFTKDLIAKVIRDGLAQNKTKVEIARDIKKITNGEITRMRAARIARTETTFINSEATKVLSDVIPYQQNKRWLPRLDGREREAHGAMQGQKPILKNELFNVGGQLMEYPADSKHGATASNIVNCRCAVHYGIVEEQEDNTIESTRISPLNFLKNLLFGILSSVFFK